MTDLPAPPSPWWARMSGPWSLVWRLALALVVGLAGFALTYGPTVERLEATGTDSIPLAALMVLDVLAAPLALTLLAWRRRPALGAVIVLVSSVSTLSAGAGIIAAISFASTQRMQRVVALGLSATGLTVLPAVVLPDPDLPPWAAPVVAAGCYAVLVLIGLYVRSRRQLIVSLQAQAQATQREQEALHESAQTAERSRIAREMHDALGHRLSVIAMHAGALESRADLSATQTQTAAGVVRESAHQAMDELRQVLGVLHESSSTRGDGTDVPSLAQLDDLVATGVGAGVVPDLRNEVDVAAVPASISRHLYRIAQEALTNVRKHAPGQPTTVSLRRLDEAEVELVVRNRVVVPAMDGSATTGGRHHGLSGLAERARLAGGSITAGPLGQDFVVRAVLPCPT